MATSKRDMLMRTVRFKLKTGEVMSGMVVKVLKHAYEVLGLDGKAYQVWPWEITETD